MRPSDATVHERIRVPESSVRACRERLEKAGTLAAAEKVAGRDGKVQAAQKKQAEPKSKEPATPVVAPVPQDDRAPSSPITPVTTNCKPRSNTSTSQANNAGVVSSPKLLEQESEPGLQEPEILQVLEAAERVLKWIANEGWAGIHSPDVVTSRIQTVIEAGEAALKGRGGTASVAA